MSASSHPYLSSNPRLADLPSPICPPPPTRPLHSERHIGMYKSEVAAQVIQERVPGVTVTAHKGYVQKQPPEFYKQFNVVIGGLDNVDARRWINSLLCSFVEVSYRSVGLCTPARRYC